jgi:hypothetical protein
LELQREEFKSKLGELRIADCGLRIGNQLAQARGKAGKFFLHAVFVYGWFSATADRHYNAKSPCGKREALFLP